jgi:hypothetical protein
MRSLIGGILALLMVGCCGNLSRESAYHDGVKQYTIESGMVSEYEAYITADPKLKDDTKKIRLGTAAGLKKLIAQEEESLKKDK